MSIVHDPEFLKKLPGLPFNYHKGADHPARSTHYFNFDSAIEKNSVF